jgi:ABC-type transport system substrate-binding protein
MQRLVKSMLLAAAILVTGCLAAACVQSASAATTPPAPSVSAPTTATAPPSPPPPSPTPSAASPPAAPSTVAPTTPASSSPASSGGSSLNLIWLWIILGALVLVLIIVLATRSPGSSAAAVNWQVRAGDAYQQAGAFDTAVREGQNEGAFLDRDDVRWHDIQRRADDLTQGLYILRETAPSAGCRAQVDDALAALQAVRRAVDAGGAPSAQQRGILHSRLAALEASLNALRVPDEPL